MFCIFICYHYDLTGGLLPLAEEGGEREEREAISVV